MRRTCTTCAGPIGARNQSGFCRPCSAARVNSDPAIAARRKAAIQARFADPEVMAAHKARLQHYMNNMPAAERAKRAARGRELYETVLSTPEVMAKREAARLAPEATARRGRKLSDRMLPWCPREHRPLYRELRRTGLAPAEARAAVEDHLAHLARRVVKPKKPLTHEEQMARVAAGAKLVAVPRLCRVDHDYTLGGVSAGML